MPRTLLPAVRRHLRWVLPLAAAPVVYVLAMLGTSALDESAGSEPDATDGLLILLVLAVALVAPLVLLVVALVQGQRVYRAARLRAGRLTRREREERDRQASAQHFADVAWQHAVQTAAALVRGERPATMAVWDVVPLPGEVFYADVPIGYARYYGTTVHYTQTSGLFVGSPAFVLAGLAGTAVANASARSAAQRQAADQWREHQTVRLVVSDRRLLVQRGGEWIWFHHTGASAVYPDPLRRGLVCQYPDTSPLMLQGDYAPFAAVVVLAATHGAQALREHPAMAPLAPPARVPELPGA
ncbi:hypothetical protein [Cellulomonas oligotrophica]|uniref:Uncharacterized protein n=1 Tax=Cellulomonas oligotrophica TaxID=931536 RepID=A0A7Y9FGN1_9CELL|nr:hypothetical protein [Cellulomonas oligotrophica]NYD87009.1 hypothetical protein [Cellulomonas oligotrophica]GIG32205.1 hypothetical protein Col01nite_13640 [Cellulomonas oligotrophica]